MSAEPCLDDFRVAYATGRPQIVWRRIVDDLETPVSAYLKIAPRRALRFPVRVRRGRCLARALLGHHPAPGPGLALPWRSGRDRATATTSPPDASRRSRAARSTACATWSPAPGSMLPRGLPPMAAGVFGAIGYDMIRLVERLPDVNPDPLDLPDAILIRPSIVAIFDGVAQEIVLVTTVWPSSASGRGRLRGGLRAAATADASRAGQAAAAAGGPSSRSRSQFASPVIARGLRRDRRAGQALHPRPATSSRWCPATASARRSPRDPVRALSLAAPHEPLAVPVLS